MGEVLFLPCFLHAHFSYYVRHIDTYRQSTTQEHGNTNKHGENRTFPNETLHRSILAGRLTLQKYYFVAFVSAYPEEAAFFVRYTWTRGGSCCTWPRLAGSEAGPILTAPGAGEWGLSRVGLVTTSTTQTNKKPISPKRWIIIYPR